jgi:hypothetical protein
MAKRERAIWERWTTEGEGAAAYHLFLLYIEMGMGRSARAVAEKTDREIKVIYDLQTRFHWAKRAKAYDEFLARVEQNAIENKVQEEATLWAKRRLEHRHKEFNLAEKLYAKVEEMLAVPLFETVENKLELVNGDLVATAVTVKPMRWSMRDITTFAETLSKLARLSLELETSRDLLNVVNLRDDHSARLQRARQVLIQQVREVDALVETALSADPTLDPEETKASILQMLPEHLAKRWDVDAELLRDTMAQLPHSNTNSDSGTTELTSNSVN